MDFRFPASLAAGPFAACRRAGPRHFLRMALRPDKCIIRGEIDNTVRGRVTGTLWLLGRDEPVTLDLSGDAWADVAGCRVAFTNPDPKNDSSAGGMAAQQTGRVGDITASNKRKVFTVPEEEWSQALNEGRLDEVPREEGWLARGLAQRHLSLHPLPLENS